MAAKLKLTPEQWFAVRARWEDDPRTGYQWITVEMELPVSKEAVRQRAVADGWAKGGATNQDRDQVDLFAADADPAKPPKPRPTRKERIPLFSKLAESDASKLAGKLAGKQAIARKPAGRPSLYRVEYDDVAYRLGLLGFTNEQIADFIGVNVDTLYAWLETIESFSESLNRGKTLADADVAQGLYARAVGYSHDAEKIFFKDGEIARADYTEHYPPDTGAAKLWLTNRQPHLWREKVEVKQEIDVRAIPWDEIRQISDQALAQAEEKHRAIIEGRAERLGLKLDYTSDPLEADE